jgi:putative DNA primase/helicase
VEEHGKLAPGVWYFGVKEKKDEVFLTKTRIASPIHVEAITSDESGNNYGRFLRFLTTNRKWALWPMPMALLAGSGEELRAILFDRGAQIYPQGRQAFLQYLQAQQPKMHLTCTSRVGWHSGDRFVLPDDTFGPEGAQEIIFQNGEREQGDYGKHGVFEEWQSGVANPAVGNPTLAFALSCAFVGPLLNLCGSENGGLHLVGESSTGKTTLIKAAASVWGSPQHMRTWNATANGLEGVAELFNDSLLPLDEISQCDPRHVGPTAYSLMNGKGKQRADRTGLAPARCGGSSCCHRVSGA